MAPCWVRLDMFRCRDVLAKVELSGGSIRATAGFSQVAQKVPKRRKGAQGSGIILAHFSCFS